MGLYVHSLGEIPAAAKRAYYVYLLDYGWESRLGEAVRSNIPRMADLASKSDAVVIHGPRGVHFEDEVLSWHHINGRDAENILPAILVTTRHPRTFRESFVTGRRRTSSDDALLILPLKKLCTTPDDVVDLIAKVFRDIEAKKAITGFEAAKEMRRGIGRAIVDAVILQPKIGGIGFDLKKFFSKRKS